MISTLTLQKQATEKNKVQIIDFYNEATEDYKFWSKDFNMHFGYYIPFKTCVFTRDSMLNQMNHQVLKRLGLSTTRTNLIDLGCGMGGTMRYALKKHNTLTAFGVTLSDFQVQKGNELLANLNGTILKENYNSTSFKDNTFDAATAIESFCHSGHSKDSIQEAFRILKPKGTLVIADAFLKKPSDKLNASSRFAHDHLCHHYSLEKLETIDTMVNNLKQMGFKHVKAENISYRVAPSVFHVPFAILGFMLKKLFTHKKLKRESLHNLKGSFYALLSGLHLKSFGYYLITAIK